MNKPVNNDETTLARMGYPQELSRSFSALANFSLSFSIICILAGGITSFHLGYCAIGPAAIGIGWPVAVLFSLAVAANMAQIASAFPTAGGLYHWGALLGGRGFGWFTAWFNLAGLVTVLAAINVGSWRFLVSSVLQGEDPGEFAQLVAVALITLLQLIINLAGGKWVGPLTTFSGFWITGVTVVLVIALLAYGGPVHPERLMHWENFSGLPGPTNSIWPASESLVWLFFFALLLPAYTITGFDGSAHASEETHDAARTVPRAILRAVLLSGLAGWILLGAAVLAIDDTRAIALQGERAFVAILEESLPGWALHRFFLMIFLAQFLCGMATVTSASRMAYAFARDGGLPFSSWLRQVTKKTQVPANSLVAVCLLSVLFTFYSPVYSTIAAACTILLYLSYVLPTLAGLVGHGRWWTVMGPWHLGPFFKPLGFLSVLGSLLLLGVGIQPPAEKAGFVVAGFTAILIIFWWCYYRSRFAGPPVDLKTLQEKPHGDAQ
ncbi:MAG: amino acid permease [Gemmataceae bacterium]|nr:amino acid permease [Gemmataceae bacterium]